MIKVKKLLGNEARLKLKNGIDIVADYTKLTLGPKGRNVAFNKIGPLPTRVINDGVSIAQEIKDDDPFVQAGIEMVQEICRKTNDLAGDGTTQTALLAQAITEEGQKRLLAKINPMDIKRELEVDLKLLLVELGKMSNKVTKVEDVRNIATISGNNDEEIGNAIAEIVEKVGMNASIIIERGADSQMKTETVKGIYFDRGYKVPAFINNLSKMIAEYNDPHIIVAKEVLRFDDEISPFFEALTQYNADHPENYIDNIVLICRQIEGAALMSLASTNRSILMGQEGLHVLVVEAPSVGPDQDEILEDIAKVTGAKVMGKETQYDFVNFKPENLLEVFGSCERFMSNSKTTTIIGGSGDKHEVEEHIAALKQQKAELRDSEKVTREKMQKRIDMLESGIGIIYTGGSTEIEIRDRALRLEDAALASKSAITDGFVAGGGFTYLLLSKVAQSPILREALLSVTKQVANNAGVVPEMVVTKCLAENIGWNARTNTYEDLLKAGVIDATLVLKNALQNAVSLAVMFLTTEALLVEYEDSPDKKGDFRK